ncbi:hypothetical protein [Tepidibacillus marianensis]|uniref:hypothetical protein n=1 Tax=Tepidibacillus marianensis TaxID=3131995 RepID=UPI0030CB9877
MKRTKHSKDFTIEIGNQTLVARRYELNPNMVSRWIREYKDGKFADVELPGGLSYGIKLHRQRCNSFAAASLIQMPTI